MFKMTGKMNVDGGMMSSIMNCISKTGSWEVTSVM